MNYVTFCTPEYAAVASKWKKVVTKLGGNPIVIELKGGRVWALNTLLKPGAILQAIEENPSMECFVYLDADAEPHGSPDIGTDKLWDVGLVSNPNPKHKNRITAACIFFKVTPETITFLEAWKGRCNTKIGKDHHHLTKTIEAMQGKVEMVDADNWMTWTANGLSPDREQYTHVAP